MSLENVPNAEVLIRLMSAWSSLPASKFHKAYPFFEADRKQAIEEYGLLNDDRARLEATALLFSEYADDLYASGTEARRAEIVQQSSAHDGPTSEDGDAQ